MVKAYKKKDKIKKYWADNISSIYSFSENLIKYQWNLKKNAALSKINLLQFKIFEYDAIVSSNT